MAEIVLRSVKAAPLTVQEVDDNFDNLNTDKIEVADAVSTNTATKVVRRDENGDFAARIVTVSDLNSTSDRNVKENIAPIDPTIIHHLNPVEFTWKQSGKKSYGVIAQELQQVLPELVSESGSGELSVSYIPLIAILMETIKQQEKRITALESLINK